MGAEGSIQKDLLAEGSARPAKWETEVAGMDDGME